MISGNLTKRIFTGVIAGVATLTLTFHSVYTFLALLALITLLAAREWLHIGKHIYTGNLKARRLFALGFIPYFAPALIALGWLRFLPQDSAILVCIVLALVWTTDIAAYATGRTFGGPKLAPAISPNKTWAGLIGAILATTAVAFMIASHLAYPLPSPYLLGIGIAVIAQSGDFFESWLKRKASLKDSGTLLPGHGGILDRIDGLITAAPFFAALQYIAMQATS